MYGDQYIQQPKLSMLALSIFYSEMENEMYVFVCKNYKKYDRNLCKK